MTNKTLEQRIAELGEARRVIEELRAQLESKNELISNLINGE